jgi:hypothetical protein
MKKNNVMITAAIAITAFTACNTPANEQAKQDVSNLNQYVDSVDKLTPVYTTGNWSAVDKEYQERAMKAENAVATLEAADKEKVEASKTKYANLKANYEAKIKEQEQAAKMKDEQAASTNPMKTAPDYRMALRNRLFGEGKIGADMKFDFVTAGNLLSVYKNFVNTVADNRDKYSREDWDEIKVLYEALDTRKNSVEKDLAGSDNVKIAGLKIKFAAIKATNRGGTKAAENEKAKQ